MKKQEQIDFESMKNQALEQFRSGKSLTGKGGAFAPLFKQFLEAALESELEEHLSSEEESGTNRKNGKVKKTIKTSDGNGVSFQGFTGSLGIGTTGGYIGVGRKTDPNVPDKKTE